MRTKLRVSSSSVSVTAACLSIAVILAQAGCKKGGAGSTDAALVSQGQTVYSSNGCGNCHAVNGQGGRRAPDLTHVGADPGHTSQWLITHVKNPQSQNPRSRMPAFQGKISDADFQALGAYLASLK